MTQAHINVLRSAHGSDFVCNNYTHFGKFKLWTNFLWSGGEQAFPELQPSLISFIFTVENSSEFAELWMSHEVPGVVEGRRFMKQTDSNGALGLGVKVQR